MSMRTKCSSPALTVSKCAVVKVTMKASTIKIVLLVVYTMHHTKGQFTVYPTVEVQAEGVPALFHCSVYAEQSQLSNIQTIDWRVNGTTLFQSLRPNITVDLTKNENAVFLSVLRILALPQYNGTVAQCVVYPTRNVSDTVTLLVQGSLKSVKKLAFDERSTTSTSISITWEAPFSLNLTNAEPDIVYFIDIYNISGGGELVESNHVVTTSYTFTPDNPNPDHLFSFEVTPSSNVPGALNGTRSEPVQGYVLKRPYTIPSEAISYHTNFVLSPITWQYPIGVTGNSLGRMPMDYSIHLQSIDDPDNPSLCSCSATSVVSDTTIELTLQWCLTCGLQRHRVYSFVINSINNAGTSTSDPVELSTHDVQNITVIQRVFDQSNNSEIEITCLYLSGSAPTGLLAIISSLTNLSDVHYVAIDRNGQTGTSITVNNLSKDQYSVLVYDRGEDHVPEIWPAGVASRVSFDQNTHPSESTAISPTSTFQPPPRVQHLGNGQICVNCSFLVPSVNACVVIVHSTHNTSNLLGKQLKVYSINRSVVYDCFQVAEDEYHVAVFGLLNTGLERVPVVKTFIRRKDFSTTLSVVDVTFVVEPSKTVSVIVSVVSVLLVLVLCISLGIITIAVFVWKHHKRKMKEHNQTSETDCKMTFPGIEQPNEAYNPVKTFKQNEAYNSFWPCTVTHMPDTPLMEMETQRNIEIFHTVPTSPLGVTDSSLEHIYDEPILPSVDIPNQNPEIIYAEIPVTDTSN